MTTDERLERLERELADLVKTVKWKLAEIKAKLANVGVTGVAYEDEKGEIRAAGFLIGSLALRDEKGEVRGILGSRESGSTLLLCGEKKGKANIEMGVLEDGPELVLRDEANKDRAVLNVDKDGPRLRLRDEKGNVRASLGMTPNGPRLALFDEKGEVIWSAP
ncbi:MAG TPA: hypothetical protein VM431_09790 [Phycisphaerae bacterium]|nr:hypothetical protein [Phycisphaerae bacterium]